MNSCRCFKLGACLLCVLTGVVFAQSPDDRIEQMEKRMAAMEAELQRYRAAGQQTIKAVQDDAAARSTPVAGKFGYGNGFFIADQNNHNQLRGERLAAGAVPL